MKKNFSLVLIFLTYFSFSQENQDGISYLNIEAEDSILDLLKEKECSTQRSSGKYNPCKNRSEVSGYMISVITSRQESEIDNAINRVRRAFPTLRIEKKYNQPDWRLLVGDYFSKRSGEEDLSKVKRFYPTALLINWRIYCNRAK